jgi:hypothetical protein
VIEIKPVGVKQTEFKVDERRFVRLFRDLMKGSSPGGSLQDMFLAFCLKEICWKLFCENGGFKIDNLEQFKSDLDQCAVKFAAKLP